MLRLVYDNDNMDADLSVSADGTDVTRPLDTAVILSLFCDARARVGDDILEGTGKRGWWAESYFEEPDRWGSDLWQSLTRKATGAELTTVRRSAERALEWMIVDGICRQIDVETWWIEGRQGYMGILVRLHKPDSVDPQYAGPWEWLYAVD